MEEHVLMREYLASIGKRIKVVEFRNTITSKSLSSPKVAQHSNGVAKRLTRSFRSESRHGRIP
jgi:hypothetical protein